MRDVNGQARGRLNSAGKNVRNMFADYFLSEEGAVPWQDDSVARGELFPETSYTTLYIEPTFKIHHLTLSALSIKYVVPFQYTPR
jgi:hypothetical protein